MGVGLHIVLSVWTMICTTSQCVEDVRSESNEDAILKDALLLVKLLKSREPTNISALFPSLKITAPGTPESPLNVSHYKDTQSTLETTTATFSGIYRRKMSNDEAGVNSTLTTSEASATITVTIPSTASKKLTNLTATTTVQTKPVSITRKSLKPSATPKLQHMSSSQPYARGKKMKIKQKPVNVSQKAKSPINETDSNKCNEDQSSDVIIKAQVQAAIDNEFKRLYEKRWTAKMNRQKLGTATVRVYLGRSTPLQLPLPANHAFCFTNPNNRLCRTII